jgi:hypothetical protein
MSIQEYIAGQRNGVPLKLKASNMLLLLSQIISRHIRFSTPRVFFPYRNLLNTHPIFLRYYKNPPLHYSNFQSSQLAHWINAPDKSLPDIFHIIEPNDHPLCVTGFSEPKDVIASIDKAIDIYCNASCRKILVESKGQLELFKRYLPESVIRKTEIIGQGTVAKEVDFNQKWGAIKSPTFLCLASDFQRKAVDILVKAWLESNAKKNCVLVLACPNTPPEFNSIFEKNNIKLIRKAPLTSLEKAVLHKNAHVSIAPLHVDGGTNIIEAFEFGLPVITMRSQRSYVNPRNGWEVDVPFYFYDSGYGRDWLTWNEFWNQLSGAKKAGKFDSTINELCFIFNKISQSPEILVNMSIYAHGEASGELSLSNRNIRLLEIYKECSP